MIKLMYKLILISIFFTVTAFVINTKPKPIEPDFLRMESRWVDSVYNSLTPDQRLAQLFMVAAYSNKDMKHVRDIRELIQKYNIGGLIFMQGGPQREAKLTNYYQNLSKTPLLISIDGEWGLAMRLDSTPKYPRQMTLGAIQNDSLIFKMGKQIAKECKRIDSRPILEHRVNPKPSQRTNSESGLASGSGGNGTLHNSRQPAITRRPKSTIHQKADTPKI
jgi:hypothetical protein